MKSQAGIAFLETSLAITTMIAILITGWASIDIYQQAMMLEQLIEQHAPNELPHAYRIELNSGQVEINREELLVFLHKYTQNVTQQLQQQAIQADRYYLQGALIEIEWSTDHTPTIAAIRLANAEGTLSYFHSESNFRVQTEAYLKQLRGNENSWQGSLRTGNWFDHNSQSSFLAPQSLLLGFNASYLPNEGLGKALLTRLEKDPLIVRTSFLDLRKDL